MESCSLGRLCNLCGFHLDPWTLIGGGYDDNWFAALLRESFPLALCETCFRKAFYKPIDSEPVGIAVLPDVESRSIRALEVEKYLVASRRRCGITPFFNAQEFLTSSEIDDLLKDYALFRSIHIGVRSGNVSVAYSFASVPHEGLCLVLSQSQTSAWGLLGFSMETNMSIRCTVSTYQCDRTVSEFLWLRSRLSDLQGPLLLPLSPVEFLGYFSEGFLETRLSVYERFLRALCVTEPYKSSLILKAFLRPGFKVARAFADVEAEDEKDFRLKRFTEKAQAASIRQDSWVLICASLREVKECITAVNYLNQSLLMEFTGSTDTSYRESQSRWTCDEYSLVDLIRLAEREVVEIQDDTQRWKKLSDFFLV